MFVLRFAGPERWAYINLGRLHQNDCLAGPLRQLLGQEATANCTAGREAESPPLSPANIFHCLLPDASEDALDHALPAQLRDLLDKQQRATIVGVCGGNHRLHFVRAYAGTGKTQVGKSLVWLFMQQNLGKAPSAQTGKRDVALWLVRTKVLREEILHDLLDMVLESDAVFVFGGAAASTSGDTEDKRFRDRVLAQAPHAIQEITAYTEQLATAFRTFSQCAGDVLEPPVVQTVRRGTVLDPVKVAAAKCMRRLWDFFNNDWPEAVKLVMEHIQLIVCTVDVFLKISAKDAAGPASTIFRAVQPAMALMDEVQRIRDIAFYALAGLLHNIVGMGDPLQKLSQSASRHSFSSRVLPWATKRMHQAEADKEWSGEQDLDQLTLQPATASETELVTSIVWADEIMEAKKSTVPIWTISGCKRCGEPLVGFICHLAGIYNQPDFQLTASVQRQTYVHHIFYRAGSSLWRNLWDICQRLPPRFRSESGSRIPTVGVQLSGAPRCSPCWASELAFSWVLLN
jgi:hypothetical protein